MDEVYSKKKKLCAMTGVALILATAAGGTSIMNSVVALLLAGMQINLTTFMIGPAIATICAAIMSAMGTKLITLLSPKWSMLLGTVCSCVTMFLVGIATSVPLWIIANVANGIVLAFATWAAAGGIIAEFYGKDTQKVFGILSAIVGILTAAWLALTSILLNYFDYRTLFSIFAVAILIIGVISNICLIGKIPRRQQKPAGAAAQSDLGEADAGPAVSKNNASGFSLAELLKHHASIYLFLGSMVLVAWCASGITSYASVFFTSFQMSPASATAMLSVYTLAGAVLVFCAGFLIKKIGPKIMTVIIYCGFALGIVILLIWSQTQIALLAPLGIILCAFISFAQNIPGLFIPDIYGMKDYVGINSAGQAGYYVGAITVLMGLSIIVGAVGYLYGFAILAIISLVVMAFLLGAVILSPMKKKTDKA